jgi:hypothetical protein
VKKGQTQTISFSFIGQPRENPALNRRIQEKLQEISGRGRLQGDIFSRRAHFSLSEPVGPSGSLK